MPVWEGWSDCNDRLQRGVHSIRPVWGKIGLLGHVQSSAWTPGLCS